MPIPAILKDEPWSNMGDFYTITDAKWVYHVEGTQETIAIQTKHCTQNIIASSCKRIN